MEARGSCGSLVGFAALPVFLPSAFLMHMGVHERLMMADLGVQTCCEVNGELANRSCSCFMNVVWAAARGVM